MILTVVKKEKTKYIKKMLVINDMSKEKQNETSEKNNSNGAKKKNGGNSK